MRHLPNVISVLRLFAAPLFVVLVVGGRFDLALLLGIPIAISDWADGFVARRFNGRTAAGVYLDPAADKVLLVSAFLSLGAVHVLPVWLIVVVMGRDLVITIGVFLLWKLRGRTDFKPMLLGKISTTFQILTVLVSLLSRVWPRILFPSAQALSFGAAAIFSVLSGAGYVMRGIRMARRLA